MIKYTHRLEIVKEMFLGNSGFHLLLLVPMKGDQIVDINGRHSSGSTLSGFHHFFSSGNLQPEIFANGEGAALAAPHVESKGNGRWLQL